MFRFIAILCLVVGFAFTVWGKPAKPDVVLFGVYPVNFYDFNFSNRTFKTSFYAWWRTQNPNYKPFKSVEITNAVDYRYALGQTGKNQNEYFSYVHCYATIKHDWDVRYFPFDRQYLNVRLEDFADANSIEFEPDYAKSGIHKELTLEGWDIVGMKLAKSLTTYDTNFGDSATPQGLYSRLTFTVELKHQGWRAFFNYFIGFFAAFMVCCMVYLIDPKDFTRFSLIPAAVFAAVGNKYVLDQFLPFTTVYTLSDTIQIATFLLLLIAILSSIILKQAAKIGILERNIKKINFVTAILCITLYLAVICVHTYLAVIS